MTYLQGEGLTDRTEEEEEEEKGEEEGEEKEEKEEEEEEKEEEGGGGGGEEEEAGEAGGGRRRRITFHQSLPSHSCCTRSSWRCTRWCWSPRPAPSWRRRSPRTCSTRPCAGTAW